MIGAVCRAADASSHNTNAGALLPRHLPTYLPTIAVRRDVASRQRLPILPSPAISAGMSRDRDEQPRRL